VSIRLHLDFRHGLVESSVEPMADGDLGLSLLQGQECVIVRMSEGSLAALWMALTVALARHEQQKRKGEGPGERGEPQ
jgi:hypothetical protein